MRLISAILLTTSISAFATDEQPETSETSVWATINSKADFKEQMLSACIKKESTLSASETIEFCQLFTDSFDEPKQFSVLDILINAESVSTKDKKQKAKLDFLVAQIMGRDD